MTDDGQLTDGQIVARVLGGETALYELLMRRYNQRLYRTVRAILQNESDAEETLQDTYVNAFRRLNSFEGRASFSTWLIRIGVNQAIDRRRRELRVVPIEPAHLDALADAGPNGPSKADPAANSAAQPNPEAAAASGELTRLLTRAIDRLPQIYRTVYMLREVEGLNVEETAECLSIDRGTVKTRLHRARAMLRQTLYSEAGASASDTFTFAGDRCDRTVAGVLARLRV